MQSLPEIFIYLSTGFIIISIPTVFILYIVDLIKRKKNIDHEIKALKKPLSRLEKVITVSAGTGLILLGIFLIAWISYNLFINRLNQFQFNPSLTLFPFALCFYGWLYFRAGINGKRANFRIWGCKYCKELCYGHKIKTPEDISSSISLITNNINYNTITESEYIPANITKSGRTPFLELSKSVLLKRNIEYYFECTHCEQLFRLIIENQDVIKGKWKPINKNL